MKFSERKGFRPISEVIQTKGMTEELRNSLWNLLHAYVWEQDGFVWRQYGEPDIDAFSAGLWFCYFKKPIDSRPDSGTKILRYIRDYFFTCDWYGVYDFLEYILGDVKKHELNGHVNEVLERELSGYRYVGGVFTDITGEEEVKLLDQALNDSEFPGVRAHLEAALRLLSNRDAPDYRNSIKESISAVESMAKAMTGQSKTTLVQALKVLEKSNQLHPALREGFSKLYGYTSDEEGIRHAMLEEPNLTAADAKFFLLSCTSFINYLKAKL